jgi:oligoribonuclease NrnB/cAMP/cGMP phosphodiesterase (DHH superfamily)
MEDLKNIVVIYHDQCRDGFGSAYAAWKKFGDTASYIPRKTQQPVPDGLVDKELYILDYSYGKEDLDRLVETNRSVLVIDHHESARAAVTAFPDNIFDINRSGAVLSWQYFHPGTEVPPLLLYVEDHDIWNFALPHHREFNAALGEYSQDFETWDQLNKNFTDKDLFDSFIRHGAIIAGFEDKLIRKIFAFRERAEFEGHEIYVLNAERVYRSILGHMLATRNEEEGRAAMGIVYYRYDGMVHCSLRSNGDCNVAEIAQKYGGGGHKNAASLRVATFNDLPFRFV